MKLHSYKIYYFIAKYSWVKDYLNKDVKLYDFLKI